MDNKILERRICWFYDHRLRSESYLEMQSQWNGRDIHLEGKVGFRIHYLIEDCIEPHPP